jgi:hypothetical protein
MILSDFVPTGFSDKGLNNSFFFAEVTVTITTGALWWKKTKASRRKIARDRFGMFWFFVDDGTRTPGFQAEELERSFNATNHYPSSHHHRP